MSARRSQPPFIGARAVERWERHVEQSQIHRELSAVMRGVLEQQRANRDEARRREELAAFGLEGPRREQFRIGACHDRLAYRRDVGVISRQRSLEGLVGLTGSRTIG